jgi:light-regulated signal transduction histidine kinase (bacteriophytochrome)
MLDIALAGPQTPYANLRAPGHIQSYGVMLTLHPRTHRVLNASLNVEAELGVPHARMLGRSLFEVIEGSEVAAEIQAALAAEEPSFMNPLPVTIGKQPFDLVMYAHDGLLFADFERLLPGAPSRAEMDALNEAAIIGMMVPGTMPELMEVGPRTVREATGFDRVLLYRFDESMRGQVVGEALRPGVDSYMGMFFPEGDIPPPARTLFTENTARYIPQIGAAATRLDPPDNPLTNRPVDISRSALRAVHPCHVEYLTNMGVTASLAFSIVLNGRLWGLFACHHYGMHPLSYTQRLVCEQIAMMFSAKLVELVNPQAVEEDMMQRREVALGALPLRKGHPLRQDWNDAAESALLSLVNAEGAAIYVAGEVGKIGACPDLADLHSYIETQPDDFERLLKRYDEDGLFYTSSIASVLPFGAAMRSQGSGVLIVPLARDRPEYIFWFRPELIVKATWAGNPTDSKVRDPNARLSPRSSFAAWKEDIRDRAEPWTELEIANAVALRDWVLGTAA